MHLSDSPALLLIKMGRSTHCHWCAVVLAGLAFTFAMDAKARRKLLAIWVLIAHDFLGVNLGDLDISMSESPSQVGDRRSRADHADGERMAQAMYLARFQIG